MSSETETELELELEHGLQIFNTTSEEKILKELYRCCACNEWCRRVCARRPFTSYAILRDICDDEWWKLTSNHWRESFNGHPRIGDKKAVQAKESNNSKSWEGDEQKGTSAASDNILEAIASGNLQYEEKFGFIFLICATNKSADHMLNSLNKRLANDDMLDEVNYDLFLLLFDLYVFICIYMFITVQYTGIVTSSCWGTSKNNTIKNY